MLLPKHICELIAERTMFKESVLDEFDINLEIDRVFANREHGDL